MSDNFVFPTVPETHSCSFMTCCAGHKWEPTLQLVPCPGCKSPMLAIKTTNCPYCNEPGTELTLRADHLPVKSKITPICKGSATLAESFPLHIQLRFAQLEEANHKEREVISKP